MDNRLANDNSEKMSWNGYCRITMNINKGTIDAVLNSLQTTKHLLFT